jgi:hypothetical protein
LLPIVWEAKAFEPVDQVVSKQDKLKVGLIARPIPGGYFAKRISFEQFSDNEFSCRSLIVEAPEIERFQREIGDNYMVGVSSHLEKRKLPGRFFGDEAPHNDKALGSIPPPRFVFEFGEPKPRRGLLVRKASEESLDRLGDPGDNRIECGDSLEVFGNRMIVEGRIGSDPNLSNSRRQLGDTFFQNPDGMRSRMDIAGEVDSFPDIARLPLETEKRLIGRASPLLGVEAHFGALLLPINSQNLGIEIEDHGNKRMGLHQKGTLQSVVKVLETRQTP